MPRSKPKETCYLVCFSRPYRHARHYLGTTKDLAKRLEQHAAGTGARLMEVIKEHGITFTLVRTWDGGRDVERKLKRRKEGPRLCPVCSGKQQPMTCERSA